MKGKKLAFSAVLGLLLSLNNTYAESETDVARAATLRSTATTVVSNRQKSSETQSTQNVVNSGISRTTTKTASAPQATNQSRNITSRTGNVVSRDSNVVTRDTGDTSNQQTSARTTSNVQVRSTTNQKTTVNNTNTSRSATTARSANSISRAGTVLPNTSTSATGRSALTISRAGATPRAASNLKTEINSVRSSLTTNAGRISRSAETAAEEVLSRDYDKCREVYNSCMDEFCANKDSQLKRCACSARVNEFDNVKAQLAEAEDKMLDFNQRLLTVNMDKEDAEALFEATEGELAFNQEDTSESKKMLDEIAEKLNTTFDDSNFNQNLSPISLSLNADAAFDSVDSMFGSSTVAKSGTDLYAAALPICREMALEVCSQEDLDIAESGYQMLIEQDCNTVAKSYETQKDKAVEKIREGSALLDMSRLDIYQKRNSDDILTCKKKMLDMLTESSVCGDNLEKCLDISGKYIDPSSGEAILTTQLADLGTLITRPSDNQKWTKVPGNEKFVSYLDSKKKYLEPAMENCQDVSDYVWDLFIEDALAQIKLAQESKLEEVRQSCTTLTTQCLSDTAKSIEDFDARALSIFGVEADKTVREMCAEVTNACTALLDTMGDGEEWGDGMTEIATDKTYETILSTCREVGRACIIQSCKSVSGNFGLCENIQTSVNRKSIINRTACWDEVVKCVNSAGEDSIEKIITQKESILDKNKAFYTQLYGKDFDITNQSNYSTANNCLTTKDGNCVFDICENECGLNVEEGKYTSLDSPNCRACRLAERVWGNCESHPTTNLSSTDVHNKIKMPTNGDDTLLSWFAKNTNTQNATDSCRDTSCGPGYQPFWDEEKKTTTCISQSLLTDDGFMCPDNAPRIMVDRETQMTNCCSLNSSNDENNIIGSLDVLGDCCLSGNRTIKIDGIIWDWGGIEPGSYFYDGYSDTISNGGNFGICLPKNVLQTKFLFARITKNPSAPNPDDPYIYEYYICLGDTRVYDGIVQYEDAEEEYPSGKKIHCIGDIVVLKKYSNQSGSLSGSINYPGQSTPTAPTYPINYFYRNGTTGVCKAKFSNGKWNFTGPNCTISQLGNYILNYGE